MCFNCSWDRPIWILPFMIAMVAGVAPLSFISCSTYKAVSRFWGYSIPWVIIVDSKATIGYLFSLAYFTSSDSSTKCLIDSNINIYYIFKYIIWSIIPNPLYSISLTTPLPYVLIYVIIDHNTESATLLVLSQSCNMNYLNTFYSS